MKGLLTKDFCLMLQRKRFFIIMLVCGFAMSFSTDGTFFVVWMLSISSLFSLSTISYDEYDNCYPFLMTLPITGKTYAIEKYVFGLIAGTLSLVLSMALYAISLMIQTRSLAGFSDMLLEMVILLVIPFLILSFSIPIDLKYGSEKGRTVLLLFAGICFVIIYAVAKFLAGDFLENITLPESEAGTAIGVLVFAVVIMGISLMTSIKIMEKKEY